MLYRLLSILTILTFALQASPTEGKIRAALLANPELLKSPQAQAIMEERGCLIVMLKVHFLQKQVRV